ncbi:MAG: hypothetical protein ABR529_11680 [Actinomycetota bacterium]
MFNALAFSQLEPKLKRGEELEDWEAAIMPPDPAGTSAGHIRQTAFERQYASLMYPDHLKGKRHGQPGRAGESDNTET